MKSNIEELRKTWQKHDTNPVNAANAISEFLKEENISVHKIALLIGARVADVAAFQSLSALSPQAQEYFEKYSLPVSLAIDLVNEEEDFQIKVLKELCDSLHKKEKILDVFENIINKERIEKYSWHDEIKGEHLFHLATKAKSYSILSGKQRKALFDFGRRLQEEKPFTIKQKKYLYDLLEICKAKKLLSKSCFKVPCEICNEIVEIVKKK